MTYSIPTSLVSPSEYSTACVAWLSVYAKVPFLLKRLRYACIKFYLRNYNIILMQNKWPSVTNTLQQCGSTGDPRTTLGPIPLINRPAKLCVNLLLVLQVYMFSSLRRIWKKKTWFLSRELLHIQMPHMALILKHHRKKYWDCGEILCQIQVVAGAKLK